MLPAITMAPHRTTVRRSTGFSLRSRKKAVTAPGVRQQATTVPGKVLSFVRRRRWAIMVLRRKSETPMLAQKYTAASSAAISPSAGPERRLSRSRYAPCNMAAP